MDLDIKMPSDFKVEGTCYEKCLQYICNYMDIGMGSYELLGIEETLKTNYIGFDGELQSIGQVNVNDGGPKINDKLNIKLPVDIKYNSSSDDKEAIKFVIEKLNLGIPIIALVNPYYLHFMDDYMTNPGGYFKWYHSTIIIGYRNDKFIVADPSLNFGIQKIGYDELIKAWTYDEGIKNHCSFIYCILEFKQERKSIDVDRICLSSAIQNVNYMLGMHEGKSGGINGLKLLADDLKLVIDIDSGDYKRIKYLENLHSTIFHGLSWTRRLFGLFLKSKVFDEFKYQNEYAEKFESFYTKWIFIANLILMSIHAKTNKRLEISRGKIAELLKEEEEEAGILKRELINFYNSKYKMNK